MDARSLRNISFITTAFVYYIASAGDAQGAWLAQLAEERGKERIDAEPRRGSIASRRLRPAKNSEPFFTGAWTRYHTASIANGAVRSVARVACRVRWSKGHSRTYGGGKHQSTELRQAVERRAAHRMTSRHVRKRIVPIEE